MPASLEESGRTFEEENATIKARHAAHHFNKWALANDLDLWCLHWRVHQGFIQLAMQGPAQPIKKTGKNFSNRWPNSKSLHAPPILNVA